MKTILFQDLGLIDYKEAWDYQEELFNEIISLKIENRKNENAGVSAAAPRTQTPNYFLFCEHPHVFTLGKSGHEENLLISQSALLEKKAAFYKINRGGDITYHGPGQIVGYPILDLENFFTDIHLYMRSLEEAIILTLKDYGIQGERRSGKTGVWLDPENPAKARKICAMGVRCSRWVTMHGFALNVNSDLNYFNYIIPCGISDGSVTSMQKELGNLIDLSEVKAKVLGNLKTVFELGEIIESKRELKET